jgi:ankyrin repeat protein
MGKYKQAKRMIDDGTIREFSSDAVEGACAVGTTKILRLLLDNGAVPTDQCFLEACEYGHADVVKILIDDGRVNVMADNCLGLTRALFNLRSGYKSKECLLEYNRIKEMLLNDNRVFLKYFCDHPVARCWVLDHSVKELPEKATGGCIPAAIVENIIDMSYNYKERFPHVRKYLNELNQESIDKLEEELGVPLDTFDSNVYDEPTFEKILKKVFTIKLNMKSTK